MKTLKITCLNQSFILHPSGAAYWEKKSMLLIADVHLGKVTHFRKHGSAIPQDSMYQNFDKLTEVVLHFNPKTVCFLGDLFHSYINNEWLLFKEWVNQRECKVVLISGNHDIIPKLKYDKILVTVKEEWKIDGFLLTHYPEIRAGYFNLSGHIHPGVTLRGLGHQFLKVSCFHKSEHQMVFPAFGDFTGKFIVSPNEKDQIFINTDTEVIKVKTEIKN